MNTVIAGATHEERLAGLTRQMQEDGVDALVATSYDYVSSLAGTAILTQRLHVERYVIFVLQPSGRRTLIVCNIEEAGVRARSDVDEIRLYVEFAEDPIDKLAELLKEIGATGKVAFELRRTPSAIVTGVQEQIPGLTPIGWDDVVQEGVMVKTPQEIDDLRAAARRTQAAIEAAAAALALGVTDEECRAELLRQQIAHGAQPDALVFGVGDQTIKAHPQPLGKPVPAGTIFRVDMVGRHPGTSAVSDLARTGVFGAPAPEQEEHMAAVMAAQRAVFDVIEPGRPSGDLWRAARDSFESAGFDMWAPHVGHGMGVAIHEKPELAPHNDTPLKAGMVLNIEPILISQERKEGYHTEDLVVVTESGVEMLSTPQTALLRIGG